MTEPGFVIAAYGVILGGIGLYAGLLARRLRSARDASRHGDDIDARR
jgi:hypothetical protein